MSATTYFQLKQCQEHFEITFDDKHVLFEAHFPSLPIVPGSCITEITRVALETKLSNKYRIRKITSVKFIKPIHPENCDGLELHFLSVDESESGTTVKSVIKDNNMIYCKSDIVFTRMS
jgi:3-hydroxyacyl-[acyl-carrier-protein] dehydratase